MHAHIQLNIAEKSWQSVKADGNNNKSCSKYKFALLIKADCKLYKLV